MRRAFLAAVAVTVAIAGAGVGIGVLRHGEAAEGEGAEKGDGADRDVHDGFVSKRGYGARI